VTTSSPCWRSGTARVARNGSQRHVLVELIGRGDLPADLDLAA